jgi:hypothetical protein
MDVKLIVVSAKAGTKEISVRRPRILGRARGIGIVIPHPAVSERHCLLFEHAGLLMIQDLNSEHGTFIGGRKIILAPLPPGTEFSVGPLTLRADYSYSGNLDSLPKALYDEPEPVQERTPPAAAPTNREGEAPAEPPPPHHAAATSSPPLPAPAPLPPPPAEVPPQPAIAHAHRDGEAPENREGEAPAEPNATPQFSSFFGFDPNARFPSVAPGATAGSSSSGSSPGATRERRSPDRPTSAASVAPSATGSASAAPPASKVAVAPAPKPRPPMPPPLPTPVQAPSPEPSQVPDFDGFTGGVRPTDEETPAETTETGMEIPGLNIDSMLSGPPPAKQHPPAKKKPGSFLDYFSKPVTRRKRSLHLAPDKVAPLPDSTPPTPATPKPPAAAATPNGSAKQSPPPQFAPPAETPPPAEPVDDDLSSFFKNLG